MEPSGRRKQIKFELRTSDMYMARSLADTLTNKAKSTIKENILDLAERNQEILDDFNRQLAECEEKLTKEISYIDKMMHGKIYDDEGKVIGKTGGELRKAQDEVKRLESELGQAINKTNLTEKKYHVYIMAEEEYELMMSSQNPDERRLEWLKDRMDKYEDAYLENVENKKKTEELFEELQEAKDRLSEVEDIVHSFKTVGDEHLELDRDSSSKTDDNLGHYITTHWGGKKNRLLKLIDSVSGLTLKNDTPQKIAEFQAAFDQNTADTLFNGFVKALKISTNQMYFIGGNHAGEFNENTRDEFMENVFRAMPYNLPERFNPFYSVLNQRKPEGQEEDMIHNAVEVISDGEGGKIKILDLDEVSKGEVIKTFCAFVLRHFQTACKQALEIFKGNRDVFVEDYEFSNADDESDGYQRSEREMILHDEVGGGFGRDESFEAPGRLDSSTVEYWQEMKSFMLANVSDMAEIATIAMRDYLPDRAYLMLIPEARAISEVKDVLRKLINIADRDLKMGRSISRRLKEILTMALGGAGNREELEIEYKAIYTAFELYMYKFMIQQEEALLATGYDRSRRPYDPHLDRLKKKRDRAQMRLNDLENAAYALNARAELKSNRTRDKVNFLLNNKRTTDGYGSGKDNTFIIDPHYVRG